jgi:cytochrome c553
MRFNVRVLLILGCGVLGAVSVLVGAACGGASRPEAGPAPATNEIFVKLECGTCHGANGEGTEQAPPLVGLAERWDEASLVAFLKDPQPDNSHIAYREEPYPIQMRSFGQVEEEELVELARFLLTR